MTLVQISKLLFTKWDSGHKKEYFKFRTKSHNTFINVSFLNLTSENVSTFSYVELSLEITTMTIGVGS